MSESKMSPEHRANLIREIFEKEIIPLSIKKGYDYGGLDDANKNLRKRGWKGIITRLDDKMLRVDNFMDREEQMKINDESLEEDVHDIIVYSFLLLLLYRMDKDLEIVRPNLKRSR